MGGTRCRKCLTGVKRNEGMPREAEESYQEGEGKDAPQGCSHGYSRHVVEWDGI